MAPKIIVVANTKGGVGKTTVALQLAIARALQGKDVWYVDGDRQQTGLQALTLRESQKVKAQVFCATYPNGALLGKQVLLQADKWDTIVIDVGGYDNAQMRMAMGVCDVLLIPYQPRTFDAWGLSRVSALIDEISIQRKTELPAYAILNCADPNDSADNKEAVQALADYDNIQYLDCPLGRRKAFATASGFGLSVAEMKTRDPKAVEEIKTLVEAVFDEPWRINTRKARKKVEGK